MLMLSSPKAAVYRGAGAAMEQQQEEMSPTSKLHRCNSLPSRSAPVSLEPFSSSSITRPYRLSPSTARGFFPSTAKPSALLQRRTKANQGLSPVKAPTEDAHEQSGPSSSAHEVETPLTASSTCKLPTAYEILRVSPSAGQQEIKASFWRLARQHHPDKAPLEKREASSSTFLEIRSAYNKLKDPQARARYDLELSLHSSPGFPADLRVPYCSVPPATISTTQRQALTPRERDPATIFSTQRQAFTPRGAADSYTPRYTPRSDANPAKSSFTPRTPYSGRNWETDQCW